MKTKKMKETSGLQQIDLILGQDIASSNEWSFDERKCWIGGRICAYAKGRAALFGNGENYELEVSGQAGATGIGNVTFSKRLKVAPKCYELNLGNSLSLQICFENVDLKKRRFTLVIKACADLPVIGKQCFTVYHQDIVIGGKHVMDNVLVTDILPHGLQAFAFEVGEESAPCTCPDQCHHVD
jgi:hypothetical protein